MYGVTLGFQGLMHTRMHHMHILACHCSCVQGVNQLVARSDDKIAAAACWDGTVRVYALKKPRPLATLRCHTKGVASVAFSRDGSWLASGSDDSRIALWRIFEQEQEQQEQHEDAPD